MCVLHIKPSFLPVDIQHTQCPCRFFILKRYQFCEGLFVPGGGHLVFVVFGGWLQITVLGVDFSGLG